MANDFMNDQVIFFAVLILTLGLFIHGRIHYDIVALLALLTLTVVGIIPGTEAFSGLGHPAVVTVGAVLVVSRGIQRSGALSVLVRLLARTGKNAVAQVGSLTALSAMLSMVINNVAALSLMMPVSIQLARWARKSPSIVLMPLAFASLLGGMVTLIGTPTNIIVATFRAEASGASFQMFDFTPVGLGVVVSGVAFLALIGWRLVPQRQGARIGVGGFEVEQHTYELEVPQALAGLRIEDVLGDMGEDVHVIGLVRNEKRYSAPSHTEILDAKDILIVEAEPVDLDELMGSTGLEPVEGRDVHEDMVSLLRARGVKVVEAVVMADSLAEHRTARTLGLHTRFDVSLLGVNRQGVRVPGSSGNIRLLAGDILLLHGNQSSVGEALEALGCIAISERVMGVRPWWQALSAFAILAVAIALATTGLVTLQIAFVGAAMGMVIFGLLSLREAYESVEWPVLVLLAAMIPIGRAFDTTGGAELISQGLTTLTEGASPLVVLATLIVVTSLLSDVISNAAAAILSAPIAVTVATELGASADPFLMGVAVGASAAFLTPIGHQSNTMVLGPGGYRFGDYWRLGLPLKIVVVGVAVPLISVVWPLGV